MRPTGYTPRSITVGEASMEIHHIRPGPALHGAGWSRSCKPTSPNLIQQYLRHRRSLMKDAQDTRNGEATRSLNTTSQGQVMCQTHLPQTIRPHLRLL